MTGYASARLGTVYNKGAPGVISEVLQVAASTNIAAGNLVYQDGSNGAKVGPTDGSKYASKIWFAENAADNSSGSKGDKLVNVYKGNAIVVGKAQGAIVVGSICQLSETTAGSFQQWAEPSDESATATFSATSINNNRKAEQKKLAVYLGHTGEGTQSGSLPTDAADAETNCVFMMLPGA